MLDDAQGCFGLDLLGRGRLHDLERRVGSRPRLALRGESVGGSHDTRLDIDRVLGYGRVLRSTGDHATERVDQQWIKGSWTSHVAILRSS